MDPAQTGARQDPVASADEAPPSTLLRGELRDSFLETPPAEKSPLGFALLALLAIALVAAAGWYFRWLPGSAPAVEAAAPSTPPAAAAQAAVAPPAGSPPSAPAAAPAPALAAVVAPQAPVPSSVVAQPRPMPPVAARIERPLPKPSASPSRPVAEAPWDPLRACANLDFGSMTSCWTEQCAGHPGDARCERLKADQQRRDATRRLLPPGVIDTPGG